MNLNKISFYGSVLIASFNFTARWSLASHETVTPETLGALNGILERSRAVIPNVESFGCETKSSISNSNVCGFVAQCNLLGRFANDEFIYRNSKGETAPNFRLRAARAAVQACLKKISPPKSGEFNSLDRKNRHEALARLYKSVSEKGEEAQLLKILTASAEQIASNTNLNTDGSSKNASESLETAENIAGVRLSEHSRKLFIESASTPISEKRKLDANKTDSSTVNHRSAQERKVERVFSKAQSGIKELLKQRRNSTNTAEIDNMIDRIDSLSVRLGWSIVDGGDCAGPDAFFLSDSNEVTICPDFAELPEASLLEISAHEAAHVIDPCAMQGLLVSSKGGRSRENTYATVVKTFADDAPLGEESESMRPGVPLTKNPFRSVIQCLASTGSIHARVAKNSDLRKFQQQIDDYENKLRARGARESSTLLRNAREAKNRIARDAPQLSVCGQFPLPARAQIQDAFADWVASKIIEAEVAEAPAGRKREIAIESTLSFSNSCLSFEPNAQTEFEKVKRTIPVCAENIVKEIAESTSQYLRKRHPDVNGRVDRIFLAQPKIRTALGCKNVNSKPKKCE